MAHIRIIGCRTYVHRTHPRGKLSPQGLEKTCYRILDPDTMKVAGSVNVSFNDCASDSWGRCNS